ncbi:esterase [Geothrix limicola]|uniref:Esterase n=1 Tax=Geothrix limicola TaxID=2927978 RepID=A0ABQ5QDX9_9BACT|nr:alpha/beta fold hydrolase [Geothrix limicola]GLH72842.1 esterase [Geothrix limicola]
MGDGSEGGTGRMQGAEPFSHRGASGVGILVSHGFTGTPGSVMPLARRLAEAGYDVECPCLRGHGTRWEDLVDVRMEDWLEDLRQALQRLREHCPTVFVMGLSMGGALVLRLAEEDPSIRGVVVINHALVFGNPLVRVAWLLKGLLKSTPGIASDIMDPAMREPAYDRTPTAGVAQLWQLAKLVRRDLPRLQQPLLVMKSRQDHVLPLANAELTLREAGSEDKRLRWLDHSYHVATLDYDKELIAEACLAFVRRLTKEDA